MTVSVSCPQPPPLPAVLITLHVIALRKGENIVTVKSGESLRRANGSCLTAVRNETANSILGKRLVLKGSGQLVEIMSYGNNLMISGSI
jgi:hypothetical protein